MTPAQLDKFNDAWPHLSDWQKDKFIRLLIRLNNNNRKAWRLFDMNVKGEIDFNTLLRLV